MEHEKTSKVYLQSQSQMQWNSEHRFRQFAPSVLKKSDLQLTPVKFKQPNMIIETM